jgi:hypothetical protein
VLVSTAHPGSSRCQPFDGPVPLPQSLAKLFARPVHAVEIEASLGALRGVLQERS